MVMVLARAGAVARPLDGLRHLDEIDAPMFAEAAVLGDDDGADEVGRDPLERHPLVLNGCAADPLQGHQRRGRRIDEAEDDDEDEQALTRRRRCRYLGRAARGR
jgi:hypothetical protein